MKMPCTYSGFTLIEMIGVLAIMAILASVITPNALRSLDNVAITAEVQTLHNLGEQTKNYLRAQGVAPTPANWTTTIGSYADISPVDIATNKRNMARVYLTDPATVPTQRAIILSSMRTGLTLPTSANINTAVRFQDIWQTADRSLPTALSWGGWAAWSAVANSGDFLVIERVNLAPVYSNELQAYTVSLNNASGSAASYQIIRASGAVAAAPVPSPSHPVLPPLYPRDRLNLFNTAGVLNYTYVISNSGKTFTFDGTNWILP